MENTQQPSLREYALAAASVAVCTLICWLISPRLNLTNLVMVYLLGTLAVATRGSRGPAALSSVLSVLCFDFFFVPPRFNFAVSDAQYVVTFFVMFATAMIISHLTIRLRSEAESARQGQIQTAKMHAFTEQLSATRGLENILSVSVNHLESVFESQVSLLVPNTDGSLRSSALSEKELGVAQWVYDRGQPAGLGTTSLPEEEALYIPLRGGQGVAGVLRLLPRREARSALLDQQLLLDSFAHQIALALEVHRLQENAKKAEVEVETERLRTALLSSVSHDIRTPLAAIIGSAGALLENKNFKSDDPSRDLLENIQAEGERLSRLVHNLLEATRLETGTVQVRKEFYPLEEVIGTALDRLEKPLSGRKIEMNIPNNLPTVAMDALLVEQVLVNLIENGIRHTPPQSPLTLSAGLDADAVWVSVADRGRGLKPEELERVFDKFYHDPQSPGAGLGLTICRAVVNAHGGRIWAENRPGGGSVFRFTLPRESSHAG